MSGLKEFAKGIMAAVCSVLGYVFGDMDGLMTALIVLIVMDYASGVVAAAAEKKLSSAAGARGIAKKEKKKKGFYASDSGCGKRC